jgi:hypothetical protein
VAPLYLSLVLLDLLQDHAVVRSMSDAPSLLGKKSSADAMVSHLNQPSTGAGVNPANNLTQRRDSSGV